MRDNLKDLIIKAIIFEYDLPQDDKGINNTVISTVPDKCFSNSKVDDITEVIYNSIIDYAFNEFDLNEMDINNALFAALKTKLRYEETAGQEAKLRYGFFGEVLLYAILYTLFDSKPLISRGYFYNPLESSETKGYDSYHLISNNDSVELWFGEVKFHKNYRTAIKSIVDNIDKALSDQYLEKNILAMVNHKNSFDCCKSKIETIIRDWEQNPSIKIIDEIKKHNMKFVYPVLVAFQKEDGAYDQNIKKFIEHINSKASKKQYGLSIPFSIFFIVLPLNEVNKIKEDVIKWITSKKQLLS